MGFFSFIQEIAMDLGTANTIIISDDKIVVDEPQSQKLITDFQETASPAR